MSRFRDARSGRLHHTPLRTNEERVITYEYRATQSGAQIDRALCTAYIAAKTWQNGAVRDILKIPDKRLRLVSEPVKRIDAEIRALVEDMFETMYDAPGIGLAAIQIGVAKRVVMMDLSKKDDDHKPQVFINPEITWASDEKSTHEEGCLSIPEYYEEVERPAQVQGQISRPRRQDPRDRSRRPVRDLPAARDRPHQRRAVHRPHLQAQARPRHQEIHQGSQGDGQQDGEEAVEA